MSWVVEVTELCLPHTQVLWGLQGVAILVGHGSKLVQVRVQDLKPPYALSTIQVFEQGNEPLAWDLLICKHCVPLAESASFRIFPDNPSVESFHVQRGEGHGFGRCPVDFVVIDRFKAVCNVHFGQSRVGLKIVWKRDREAPE